MKFILTLLLLSVVRLDSLPELESERCSFIKDCGECIGAINKGRYKERSKCLPVIPSESNNQATCASWKDIQERGDDLDY